MGESTRPVGVIGLGIIGTRVAKTLREAGHEVFVYNRSPKPEPNFLGSPAEVAEHCRVIQIFVRNGEDLVQVANQLTETPLTAEHVIINHATVSPDAVEEAGEVVGRQEAGFVNAPFMGSRQASAEGKLVYFLGGDAKDVERARAVLRASSQNMVTIGSAAEAAAAKIAGNLLVSVQNQAIAEALGLAQRFGVDPEVFVRAIGSTGVASGLFHMKAPHMVKADYDPHFSAANMLKDVRLAETLARILGHDTPALDASRRSLEQVVEAGHGEEDFANVARLFLPHQQNEPGAG
jgi:3-hydroxyisobutyrate dehydrogenase-like beta-hydroxyacid dehydrogenase